MGSNPTATSKAQSLPYRGDYHGGVGVRDLSEKIYRVVEQTRGSIEIIDAGETVVAPLISKIRIFIDGWNDRCYLLVGTKTADQILAKANRQTTSVAAH